MNVRGLQIGQPTVVTIDGVDLLPAPKLWLGAQAVEATLDEKQSNVNRLVLTATLPNEIAPGLAPLRLATTEGVSNSVVVALDRMPQLPITETVAALPVSLHGSVPGSGVSKTTFTGKAGDDLLIEVEAKRLGSKLRPVLHLFDAQRTQVAWAMPSRTLSGDCRLATKLPRDGQYTVEVHDLQYAPPGVSFFRLKIGQWQFADLAFPLAVTRGQEVSLELLGAIPGVKLPFKGIGDGDVIPISWPVRAGIPVAERLDYGGPPPSVLLSSLPELVEVVVAAGGTSAANQASSTSEPPVPTIPVAINGRLDAPGQLDLFRFAVTPGMKLTIEVFAERLGSRIDAVLELRNKDGGVLANNDDGPNSTDPRLDFTVPAGLDQLVVALRDSLEIASDQAIYRLVVTNADKPPPEISVTAKADVANIASGESQVLEVNVTRKDYAGPLQLTLGQLPPGVTATGTEIPAGASGTLLTLTSGPISPKSADADFGEVRPQLTAQLITSLIAKSPDGNVTARARIDVPADDRSPVWLRESFGISSVPKPATPFQVAWVDAQPMSHLVLMSKPAIPVKFIRPTGTLGPIRLTFVTSQLEPRVNNQPNLILALRPEKVVEVPVDPPVKAAIDALTALNTQLTEATKQASVAQGDAKIAADAKVAELTTKKTAAETVVREAEAKATTVSELALVVPSVLPESSCDIAIKAELLNPERNVVLRTTYSPVRRLPVLNPIAVKLTGSTTIEQTLDPKTGAIVKVAGKIERLAGFQGDVNLTLTGQPGGVAITNAAVKADQTDFALELRFPANFAAGEIKGIKLIATGPPDPQTGNQPIRTETELIVKLNPSS